MERKELHESIVKRVGEQTLRELVREVGETLEGMQWAYIDEAQDYAISTTGLALTFKRERNIRLLTKSPNTAGYDQYTLSLPEGRKQALAHRLVAEAFLTKKCADSNVVNHIDGVKNNNAVHNLEWVTYSENTKHAVETGLIPVGKGTRKRRKKELNEIPNHLRYGGAMVYSVKDTTSGKVQYVVGSRDLEVVTHSTLKTLKGIIDTGTPHKNWLVSTVGTVADVYEVERRKAGYIYNMEVI